MQFNFLDLFLYPETILNSFISTSNIFVELGLAFSTYITNLSAHRTFFFIHPSIWELLLLFFFLFIFLAITSHEMLNINGQSAYFI